MPPAPSPPASWSSGQWHNGTEIEPSVEMGDRYLALTQELAGRFKAQTVK